MTRDELLKRYPNASQSFIDRNCDEANIASRKSESADPEPSFCAPPLETGKVEEGNSRLRHVSIVSYRQRLCDPDGLCGKYHLDALRYAGVISDDSAKHITYSISQEKVFRKEDECTLISIT